MSNIFDRVALDLKRQLFIVDMYRMKEVTEAFLTLQRKEVREQLLNEDYTGLPKILVMTYKRLLQEKEEVTYEGAVWNV